MNDVDFCVVVTTVYRVLGGCMDMKLQGFILGIISRNVCYMETTELTSRLQSVTDVVHLRFDFIEKFEFEFAVHDGVVARLYINRTLQ